ncbi:TetR/AcrR family transcriptional regulator [Marispirochaeta aestuarii]|uniref:TetR family transcriptional regulator n=1 Tax=Marispirochaeta aestuarii TaxID=1963862 RepID=A0A1Y1S2V1_9SPIO|nr:TetR/AcrR family transcriptional regulator [Marispirochaeta aestuarii]ORC38312.1 TetR family transcriptional regulator [Marispirochaeta aestuarii]
MGIQERKERDKKRRISEIITAARQIFISKGYTDTTMLDIAEKSELSRRTLYLYFKSKEEISFALMYNAFRELYKRIQASYEGGGTGMEKIGRLKRAYLDFYKDDFDNFYFTVYFNVKLNLRNMEQEDARRCFDVIEKILSLFAVILEEGTRDGSFRPLKDFKLTALVLGEMIQASMQQVASQYELLERATGRTQEEILTELFDLSIHSIIA